MLTKYYRGSTGADATGTLFTGKEGVLTRVIIMNNNTADATVRLFSSAGMIYFERVIPAKGDINIELDTYILGTETISIYTSLAGVHTTANFLTKN